MTARIVEANLCFFRRCRKLTIVLSSGIGALSVRCANWRLGVISYSASSNSYSEPIVNDRLESEHRSSSKPHRTVRSPCKNVSSMVFFCTIVVASLVFSLAADVFLGVIPLENRISSCAHGKFLCLHLPSFSTLLHGLCICTKETSRRCTAAVHLPYPLSRLQSAVSRMHPSDLRPNL